MLSKWCTYVLEATIGTAYIKITWNDDNVGMLDVFVLDGNAIQLRGYVLG